MPSRATSEDKDATSELFEELNRALRFCAQEMLQAALKSRPHAVRYLRTPLAKPLALPPIPEEPVPLDEREFAHSEKWAPGVSGNFFGS